MPRNEFLAITPDGTPRIIKVYKRWLRRSWFIKIFNAGHEPLGNNIFTGVATAEEAADKWARQKGFLLLPDL